MGTSKIFNICIICRWQINRHAHCLQSERKHLAAQISLSDMVNNSTSHQLVIVFAFMNGQVPHTHNISQGQGDGHGVNVLHCVCLSLPFPRATKGAIFSLCLSLGGKPIQLSLRLICCWAGVLVILLGVGDFFRSNQGYGRRINGGFRDAEPGNSFTPLHTLLWLWSDEMRYEEREVTVEWDWRLWMPSGKWEIFQIMVFGYSCTTMGHISIAVFRHELG